MSSHSPWEQIGQGGKKNPGFKIFYLVTILKQLNSSKIRIAIKNPLITLILLQLLFSKHKINEEVIFFNHTSSCMFAGLTHAESYAVGDPE